MCVRRLRAAVGLAWIATAWLGGIVGLPAAEPADKDIRVWSLRGVAGAAAGSASPAATPAPVTASPGSAPAVPPELLADLKSPDPQVRLSAVKALGKLGARARPAWPAATFRTCFRMPCRKKGGIDWRVTE